MPGTVPDRASLIRRALESPTKVLGECRQLRDSATTLAPNELVSLALATGWAAYAEGAFDDAGLAAHDARAMSIASSDDAATQDLVDSTRLEVAVLSARGELDQAEQRVDAVLATTEGANRARLFSSLGQLRAARRDFEAAVEAVDRGLAEARTHHDQASEAALLVNRAAALVEAGHYGEAATDLSQAIELAETGSDDAVGIIATHNLGVVHARRGNIPLALAHFDAARTHVARSSGPVALAQANLDQADVLLDVGLIDEAGVAAAAAVRTFDQLASGASRAAAWMTTARVFAAGGRWAAARDAAARAADHARADAPDGQLVTATEHLHDTLQLVAGVERNDLDGELLQRLERTATLRTDPGMLVDAAIVLRRARRASAAAAFLRRAAAVVPRSAPEQLDVIVAEASLADIDGDVERLSLTVDRGLDVAHEFAASLGVTELRSMLGRRIAQLVDYQIRADLAADAPRHLLETVTRARSILLVPEPTLSEEDSALVAALRSVVRALNDGSGHRHAELQRRRSELEGQLRANRRRTAGAAPACEDQLVPPGGAASFTLFHHADDLWAVVATKNETEVVRIGPERDVHRTVRALHLSLGRCAGGRPNVRLEPLITSVKQLLAPILDRMAPNVEVIVVPAPGMPLIPWALVTDAAVAHLPTLAITPPALSSRSGAALFAGPDLAYADDEVRSLTALLPNARGHFGDDASPVNAIAAFADSELVHFAAHGNFRSDHPLNSSVRLSSGPLTFWDLLTETSPRHVFFSACELGRSATASPMGLASLLLSRGAASVVASTGPARDTTAFAAMQLMHRSVLDGSSVARALASAQRELATEDPSIASFAAFGIG